MGNKIWKCQGKINWTVYCIKKEIVKWILDENIDSSGLFIRQSKHLSDIEISWREKEIHALKKLKGSP
jgi:hypothetical protein